MTHRDINSPDFLTARGNIMESLLDFQRKLLPDLLDIMQKRYHVLQCIKLLEPIGRRSLATNLEMSERVLRAEVQFLKNQNLITIKSSGMYVTGDGITLLLQLEEMMRELMGLKELERKLKQILHLDDVVVVLGDSDQSTWVKQEMGRACVKKVKERLLDKNIIAVTGGTTLAAVAEMMTPNVKNQEVLFVPARGGLGESVTNQANMVCATMAEKANVHYRLLHVPDVVSPEVYESIIEERTIKEVLELIQSSSMAIHGIGEAMVMAERRKSAPEVLQKIKREHAVAEAFGYYFNQKGEVVHKVHTVGLQLDDLEQMDCVIAVAGGASKAKAIEAYFKQAKNTLLVTDEGAAKELLKEQ